MWSTFDLSPGTTYVVRFRNASIYFRADGFLWSVAVEHVSRGGPSGKPVTLRNPPEDLEWKHSALLGAAELTLRPMLPQRPFDVQLDHSVSILPGVEIDGYIFLPLQAEILTAEGTVLATVPLRPRKNSWFGSPQEGILCEAVDSSFSAAGDIGDFLTKPLPTLAVCPVSVKNSMTESMNLARLCIPTDILSVYGREGLYATDRVLCSFTADGLQVNPRRGMDPVLGAMEVSHPARRGAEERFFSRSMDLLRSITGI